MTTFTAKTIWTGDNLEVMLGLNSESVDLIYLDLPFNSNRNYATSVGSAAAAHTAIEPVCPHVSAAFWEWGLMTSEDVTKHYTDDGEFTACAEYPLNNLPDGDEIVDALDEVTCPTCRELWRLAARLAITGLP